MSSRSLSRSSVGKRVIKKGSMSQSPSPLSGGARRDLHTRSKSGSLSGSRSRSRSRRRFRTRSRSQRSRSSRGRRSSQRFELKKPVGDREQPQPNKCLGVFGLNLRTTEEELERQFRKFGPLEKCTLVLDAPASKTGKSRGFGFVYYESIEDASKAREEMNGTDFHGNKIRVDYSITKDAHKPTPGIYFHHGKAYKPGEKAKRYEGSSSSRSYHRDYPPRRSPPPPPRDYYPSSRDYYERDYYERDRYYRDRREEDRYYADRYRDDRYSRDERYRDYERDRAGPPPPRDYYRDYPSSSHRGPPPPPRYESGDRYYARSPSPRSSKRPPPPRRSRSPEHRSSRRY